MLRQLARLGRAVPGAGDRALAVAVYADAADASVAAREAGTEGVACVDDAARALELYCELWDRTGLPWTRRWCDGLLDFILSMQDDDGRFVNFILDWDGTPNRVGRTSVAGGDFWQARAVLALAHAARSLGDDRVDAALQRGWRHVVGSVDVPSDVRVLHMMSALTVLGGGEDKGLRDLLSTWSDEVAACNRGGMLMNSPLEHGRPHLWGHVQEGVLAEAAALLDRDDLAAVACRSADLVFGPVIGTRFDLPRTQPYDVASSAESLSRLGTVTGMEQYLSLAGDARAWFDGRNQAGQPVYDRTVGRVADGIDDGRVSSRSGAEANIVGAQALIDEAVESARRLGSVEALPAGVADNTPGDQHHRRTGAA